MDIMYQRLFCAHYFLLLLGALTLFSVSFSSTATASRNRPPLPSQDDAFDQYLRSHSQNRDSTRRPPDRRPHVPRFRLEPPEVKVDTYAFNLFPEEVQLGPEAKEALQEASDMRHVIEMRNAWRPPDKRVGLDSVRRSISKHLPLNSGPRAFLHHIYPLYRGDKAWGDAYLNQIDLKKRKLNPAQVDVFVGVYQSAGKPDVAKELITLLEQQHGKLNTFPLEIQLLLPNSLYSSLSEQEALQTFAQVLERPEHRLFDAHAPRFRRVVMGTWREEESLTQALELIHSPKNKGLKKLDSTTFKTHLIRTFNMILGNDGYAGFTNEENIIKAITGLFSTTKRRELQTKSLNTLAAELNNRALGRNQFQGKGFREDKHIIAALKQTSSLIEGKQLNLKVMQTLIISFGNRIVEFGKEADVLEGFKELLRLVGTDKRIGKKIITTQLVAFGNRALGGGRFQKQGFTDAAIILELMEELLSKMKKAELSPTVIKTQAIHFSKRILSLSRGQQPITDQALRRAFEQIFSALQYAKADSTTVRYEASEWAQFIFKKNNNALETYKVLLPVMEKVEVLRSIGFSGEKSQAEAEALLTSIRERKPHPQQQPRALGQRHPSSLISGFQKAPSHRSPPRYDGPPRYHEAHQHHKPSQYHEARQHHEPPRYRGAPRHPRDDGRAPRTKWTRDARERTFYSRPSSGEQGKLRQRAPWPDRPRHSRDRTLRGQERGRSVHTASSRKSGASEAARTIRRAARR